MQAVDESPPTALCGAGLVAVVPLVPVEPLCIGSLVRQDVTLAASCLHSS